MKVVYAGPLNPGGTCLARLDALKGLVGGIHSFDVDQYLSSISPYERVFGYGEGLRRINDAFEAFARSVDPDLLWLDKVYWMRPQVFETLKHMSAFVVHHNTDSLLPLNWKYRLSYRTMRKTLDQCHVYITTNRLDHERLSKHSRPLVLFTDLGYDHRRFDNSPIPQEVRSQWKSEILFVGHYEPRTERYILALIDAGLPITVYGNGWNKSRRKEKLRTAVRFTPLSDRDYVLALKSAKICLCFVSEWNHNETSGRSFEIPVCGSFLLGMRTRRHLECFTEGKEAEFFDSPDELVSKAKFYLSHQEERAAIAAAGHRRCRASGYSWADIMKRDWERILSLFTLDTPHRFEGSAALG